MAEKDEVIAGLQGTVDEKTQDFDRKMTDMRATFKALEDEVQPQREMDMQRIADLTTTLEKSWLLLF